MKKYIIALDEGTTSARSIIFDRECNVVCMSQKEFPQIYPQNGSILCHAVGVIALTASRIEHGFGIKLLQYAIDRVGKRLVISRSQKQSARVDRLTQIPLSVTRASEVKVSATGKIV